MYQGISEPFRRMKKFMKKSRNPKIEAIIICHLGRANGPIILASATNLISGTRAKGSCTDYKMFRAESMFVRVSGLKNVTQIAGTIAMDLVSSTLCQMGKVKSRKPSMTN